MKRWSIRLGIVLVFAGCLAGMATLGWFAHGWRNPLSPTAVMKSIGVADSLIDVALLKCTSALVVVGPRDPAAEADQGWDKALSLVAATELADELQKHGFQKPLSSFNVTCKPVTQVRVVTLDDRDKLDAEISRSTATVVLYIALHSVEAIENAKTTLAFAYEGSGDLFLPRNPDIKFRWAANGSTKTDGAENGIAEAKDVPVALAGLWARDYYLGLEFSMSKSFLGAVGG